MKGPFFFSSALQSPISPQCANGVARACLGYNYAKLNTRLKSTTRKTFKCFQSGTPESRLLNNALAVCCLLNQRTPIAQIMIHAMHINLVVFVFWGALSKTPLKIYRERNSLQNSGCYKSKRVSMFILFIPL